MKAVFLICLVLIGLTAPFYANATECNSSSDCGASGCCVISPIRYSTPHCESMQPEGEICRPEAVSFNTTVHYPDGSKSLTDVYYILCPCSQGLTCNARAGGICTAASEHDNQLSHDNGSQND